MHQKLRALDMNLLLVFETIYRHRQVTSAASELAISPSALSHALSRLRATLGDDLFIRQGSMMQPTARAQNLAPGIFSALNALSDTLKSAEVFNPQTSTQTFRFAVTDYTAAVFFPSLISRLQQVAPGVSVKTINSTHSDSFEDLASGKIDFAIGFQSTEAVDQPRTRTIECFRDNYVVAVSLHHPRIRDALSLQQFLAEGHIVVNPWNEARGVIDRILDSMNIRRRIVIELPGMLSVPAIVAGSGLIITLPEKAVRTLFHAEDLNYFPVPFSVPPYMLNVCYNSELSASPGHDWMRTLIAEVTGETATSPEMMISPEK